MSVSRAFAETNLKARAGGEYPQWATASARDYGYSIEASVNPATLYQKLTWISAAVDMTAKAASVVPYEVHKETGEELADIPNHPFESLLKRPNPLQGRAEFLRDAISWYVLTGNLYIYINAAGEKAAPDELWIIPSSRIVPAPDEKSYLRGYLYDTGTRKIPLETWEVCHVKTFNPHNPYIGLSLIESLAVVAQTDVYQQKWNLNLFGKDNAKLPGLLAFSEFFDDATWTRMKDESRAEWAGTNRGGYMMLRGVQPGGVQWISLAANQKEMEFLASRQANKEEIWSKFPGLTSITDPNSTEANAIAGKATFQEYTVYPVLQAVGEAMSNVILPRYGDNLHGAFEDIREGNRILDLDEQQRYEATHTVNEVRSEYYGDEPVPDGDMPIAAWHRGSVTQTTTPPAPANPVTVTEQPDLMSAEAEAEMKAWERFAVKRAGKANMHTFETRSINAEKTARIKARLMDATTPDEVRAVFAEESGVRNGNDDIRKLTAAIQEAREALDDERHGAAPVFHLPEGIKADFTAAMPTPVVHVAAPIVQQAAPDMRVIVETIMQAAQLIGEQLARVQPPTIVTSPAQVTVQPAPVTVVDRGPQSVRVIKNARGETVALQSE